MFEIKFTLVDIYFYSLPRLQMKYKKVHTFHSTETYKVIISRFPITAYAYFGLQVILRVINP